MKKILTIALCLSAVAGMNAQKAVVDQASKLSGKEDKLPEARELIRQAAAEPTTMNDARTYYVGGKLEFDSFDKARTKQMINPNDDSVNPLNMAEQLVNGYNMYMKALPLDSVPNEKGQVKPKFASKIISAINDHYQDYWNAAIAFYNEKKYYPEAYDAFMIYGTLPKSAIANKFVQSIPDSTLNQSLFNAGLSAYAANKLPESAAAFKLARKNGSDNVQNYVYEIACWQYMTQNDSTLEAPAKVAIEEIAMDGFNQFGLSELLFIRNLLIAWVQDNRYDEAMNLLNTQINEHPDNAALYGLRAYVNDRMNNEDASLADYKKAAELPDADFETLKSASRKIFNVGAVKLNALESSDAAGRQQIKTEYFEAAKNIAERAKGMVPDDSTVEAILENIDYALTTYF